MTHRTIQESQGFLELYICLVLHVKILILTIAGSIQLSPDPGNWRTKSILKLKHMNIFIANLRDLTVLETSPQTVEMNLQ